MKTLIVTIIFSSLSSAWISFVKRSNLISILTLAPVLIKIIVSAISSDAHHIYRLNSASSDLQLKAAVLQEDENLNYFLYPIENGSILNISLQLPPQFSTPNYTKTAPAQDNLKFYLFTLYNPDSSYELLINNETNFLFSPYVYGAPLKIISHGFQSSSEKGPGPRLVREYLRIYKNYNVVLLDWRNLAALNYFEAVDATKYVGIKTASFVKYLIRKGVASLDNIHFIGHSLGAHVGGYVGSFLGAGKLARITALDPALPLFGIRSKSDRLDKTDAAFVDVIHTNGGSLLSGGVAFIEPLGHVDFYPNGGEHQPGCPALSACSHSKSYIYMEQSIQNVTFIAKRCNSLKEFKRKRCPYYEMAVMGEYVDTRYYYSYSNEFSSISKKVRLPISKDLMRRYFTGNFPAQKKVTKDKKNGELN